MSLQFMSGAGRSRIYKARPAPAGERDYLPGTFLLDGAPAGKKLQNPLAIHAAGRVIGTNYVRLMRAATSGKRRDKLSPDEAQELMSGILFASRLSERPM